MMHSFAFGGAGTRRNILQFGGAGIGGAGVRDQLSIDAASQAVQAAAAANTPFTTELATNIASNSAQDAAFSNNREFLAAQGTSFFGRKLLANATNTSALLKEHHASMFEMLLKGAGIWLAATNLNLMQPSLFLLIRWAVKTYATKLGLTAPQLAGYPALLKAIARYHIILGAKLSSAKQLKVGRSNGITADPMWNLTIIKAANGSVTVKDVQGNVGRVTKADIDAGKSVIHIVDAVLLSGDVFINAHDAMSFFPVLSTVKGLVAKASLKQMSLKPNMNETRFAPINSAFKGAPTLDNATLTNVLKYHLVPGTRTIPLDWVFGKSVETLYKGHTLSVKFEIVNKKPTMAVYRQYNAMDYAYVVPEAGSKSKQAQVIKPNIFAGLVSHAVLY
eukprot:jgi/Chrzof1/3836/Cz13g10170.t1